MYAQVSGGYGATMSDLEAAWGRDRELRYVWVAGDIEARIASGELKPGARLVNERELAAYYGVAYHTVRRAMRLLVERGLVEVVHGRGTFVTGERYRES